MAREDDNRTELQRLTAHYQEELKLPVLSAEDELNLITLYQSTKDPDALSVLIAHNVRFVLSSAMKYQNCGLAIDDIFCYGMIGLVNAIDKFDPTLGYKLSTFATFEIKQEIIKAIENAGRSIRLPSYLLRISRKINKAQQEFYANNERYPNVKELAALLPDYSEKDIKKALGAYESTSVISLDKAVDSCKDDDDSDELSKFIAVDCETPYDVAEKNILHDVLTSAIDTLSDREKDCVIKYYGLNGQEKMSCEQIGALFNVSNERVRQIVRKAESKLRNNVDLISYHEADYYYSVA